MRNIELLFFIYMYNIHMIHSISAELIIIRVNEPILT